MRATIHTIDPDGAAIEFATPDVELTKLLPLIPQIKAALIAAGYELTSQSAPAATPSPAATLQTVAVDRITATVDDGKIYWRVKGGEFQKFGLVVYPEVLKAAGLELDPLAGLSGGGWTAYYSLKENGKPKKVVRLEQPKTV